ncbi:CheY-like receiver protein [Azospirillaceae bacterium]
MSSVGYNYAKLSVLLIDDEAFTRQLIRQLLHQVGVKAIAEAANGKDGLLEILRTRPDVVFCDVHMKPVGGLEVLRQLRVVKLRAIAETPVVMLTADADAETVQAAKENTANGYLVKPVGMLHLKTRIDAILAASPKLAEKCRSM